jgi:hypothetical protein
MDESLIEDFLKEYCDIGAWQSYKVLRKKDIQRPGQAFFNCMTPWQQYQVRGSLRDPFYKEDANEIEKCIEWLMYHSNR